MLISKSSGDYGPGFLVELLLLHRPPRLNFLKVVVSGGCSFIHFSKLTFPPGPLKPNSKFSSPLFLLMMVP